MPKCIKNIKANSFIEENEKGVAFIELVISLPFFVTLILGLIDCAGAVNTYFELNRLADNAIQMAASEKQLEEGSFSMGIDQANCSSTLAGARMAKSAAPKGGKQYGMQSKLVKLAEESFNGSFGSLDKKSFCIVSTYSSKDKNPSLGSETVSMEVKANFDGITPLFKGIEISGKGHAPYLAFTDFR